jgi:hypothetical protein
VLQTVQTDHSSSTPEALIIFKTRIDDHYYSRSDGHNNNNKISLSMKSSMTMTMTMTMMMIFVAINVFIISSRNIHYINAFSSYKHNIPSLLLRNQQRVLQQPLLFAESENGNNDKLNNNKDGDTLMLDWDLSSLLSSDPVMDARFFPLMDVYDAAAICAAYAVTTTDSVDNFSPSELPSTNNDDDESSSLIPSSLNFDGPLPPSVTPYRMFVQEYNRDMGHDGRFSITPVDVDEEGKAEKGAVPSLQSDVVFCMDNPLEFIRDNLSYCETTKSKSDHTDDSSTTTTTACTSTTSSKNYDYNNGEETVIFIPGPHTVHDTTACTSEQKNDNDSSYEQQHGRYQQRSSSDRLKYYSQVLDGLPMAQIHTGTHIDQDDFDIELTSDTINSLISFGLLTNDCIQSLLSTRVNKKKSLTTTKKRLYCLRARDLDIIHTVLSRVGSDTPFHLSRTLGDENFQSDTKGLKATLIRLIDIAVESVRTEQGSSSSSSSSSSTSPHLVLMTYSATSNVLMAALSEWKNQATTSIEESSHLEKESETQYRDGVGLDENNNGDNNSNFERKLTEVEAELLLHKAITVVTISALSQGFIDGPAYIHVSMNDDHLASSLGVTRFNPDGGGKDAIYLHAVSPYLTDEEDDNDDNNVIRGHTSTCSRGIYNNDAHNMDSCVIQYLSLVRRINGVTSFREMYNLGIADADILDISPSLLAVNSLYSVHKGSVGQLDIPPHIDWELIPAMIRATGGERWLWNPTLQLGEGGVDGFNSPLPSLEYAQGELENQLGYDVYDEIFDSCCH